MLRLAKEEDCFFLKQESGTGSGKTLTTVIVACQKGNVVFQSVSKILLGQENFKEAFR